ncbi:Phosphotriesterase-like protein, partial [Operophtera brumata]
MAPKVQTGAVSPAALGRTLTHEHLAMDFTHFYRQPPPQLADRFSGDMALNTVGYLRQYPYSWKSNLVLNDEGSRVAVLNDVLAYKKFGGGTIVENSTEGLQRDIAFYRQVSKQSGVHVVAGTGHYIADMQASPPGSTEDIYNHMLRELTEGCIDCVDVKAGFMGEIANFERRAISAAGELQERLGCGVSFHPHREPQAPFEIMRFYLEAGGRADKAVMSHLDKDEKLMEFASLGCYCQFDLFGIEVSYYQLNEPTDMPSDSQRIDKIRLLVDEGIENRVLMSHDIHTKHRL